MRSPVCVHVGPIKREGHRRRRGKRELAQAHPLPRVPESAIIVNVKHEQPFAVWISVDADSDVWAELPPSVGLWIARKDHNREARKGILERVE
jgi:hypothetical protein